MLSLVRCLEKRIPVKGIPGLMVREGLPESVPAIDRVESIGFPYRDLLDNVRYLRHGGMGNIQTKRGCPFGCIYCTYPLLEGSSVRTRPREEVVRELRSLKEHHDVDYVYFVDDIFNFPRDYALGLCRSMADQGIGLKWSAFVNPGYVDEELIETMKEAGCTGVEFGTDSGSPAMLRRLGKSFSVEDISRASEICKMVEVPFAHYLLLGGPGEDEKTLGETASLMDQVEPTAVIVMVGIRIYPGTELERMSLCGGSWIPLRHPLKKNSESFFRKTNQMTGKERSFSATAGRGTPTRHGSFPISIQEPGWDWAGLRPEEDFWRSTLPCQVDPLRM